MALIGMLAHASIKTEAVLLGDIMQKFRMMCALAMLAGAVPALAAGGGGYSFFWPASYVSPGNASNRAVKLVADATAGTYSGVDYSVPANLTINNLNTLSTDYNFTA